MGNICCGMCSAAEVDTPKPAPPPPVTQPPGGQGVTPRRVVTGTGCRR